MLKCNSCRADLKEAAATNCSHLFCLDCAHSAFGVCLVCPCCESSLTNQHDISIKSIDPSEDWKSSVLSGLAPEIIIDIAARALSFHSYQIQQEFELLQLDSKSNKESLASVQRQYDILMRQTTQEISAAAAKVHAITNELELEKRKTHDIQEQLNAKSRQFSKLQTMFDKLKRKSMVSLAAQEQPHGHIGQSSNLPVNSGIANSNHPPLSFMRQQPSSNTNLNTSLAATRKLSPVNNNSSSTQFQGFREATPVPPTTSFLKNNNNSSINNRQAGILASSNSFNYHHPQPNKQSSFNSQSPNHRLYSLHNIQQSSSRFGQPRTQHQQGSGNAFTAPGLALNYSSHFNNNTTPGKNANFNRHSRTSSFSSASR